MKWVKGQSGNPAGRARNATPTAAALRRELGRRPRPGAPTNRDALAATLVQLALDGDIAAAKLVLERTEGKVPESVQLTGPAGGAVQVQVDDFDWEAFRILQLAAYPNHDGLPPPNGAR